MSDDDQQPPPKEDGHSGAGIKEPSTSTSIRSNLGEDIDQPVHSASASPSHSAPPNSSFNRRGSGNSIRHHSLPPLDEEDDDHLFQNMGLLTDSCVTSILNGTQSSSAKQPNASSASTSDSNINYDRNETFSNTTTQVAEEDVTPPLRSWTVKLQAARSYTSTTSSPSTSRAPTLPNFHRPSPVATVKSAASAASSSSSAALDLATFPSSMIAEENFNYVSVEHADTSFPVFYELWQSEQVCDVTIVVGEKRFSAHRIILCATIPYFYAMFTNDLVEKRATEVVLQSIEDAEATSATPTIEPEAFEALLRYAYTGSILINSRNVQSVLIGASFLGLANVQQACADYLKIRLNVGNVLGVKSFALALGVDSLVMASKKFVHRHFEEVAKTEDFLALDFEEVVDVIEKDELNIRGEEIVFQAILAWTKKSEETRRDQLPALLAHVRLPLLSPEYLTDTVMVEKLIRNCLACRDLVDEAKDYHLLPARRQLMQRFRTRPRFGHHIQGLIYAVGGLTKSGDSMSTVEVFDPLTKRWRMAEAMTMLRSRVGVAVLEGKLYAIGGYNGKERLNTVELYDAKTKRWQKVTSMAYRRSAVGAAPLGGYLYVCGGYDGQTSLNAVERYSSAKDTWTLMASMNFHRSAAGVVAFDGYIYALGGHDGMMIFNSVERYDPRTDRWEVVEPMLTRRCRLGVAAFNGKIFVCGGYDGTTFLQSAEVYDPNTGVWSFIAPMRITRSRVALVANCGRLFAIGGYDGITNLSSVEVYDMERECWEFSASMVAHEGGVGVGVIPDV